MIGAYSTCCLSHTSNVFDARSEFPVRNGVVDRVPSLSARVHPGSLMNPPVREEAVRHDEIVLQAEV